MEGAVHLRMISGIVQPNKGLSPSPPPPPPPPPGVPRETISIMKLHEAVTAFRSPEAGPLVVHCRFVCNDDHVMNTI